jgi:hypothetical protein
VLLTACGGKATADPSTSTQAGASCLATAESVDVGVFNIVGTGFPPDSAVTVSFTRSDGSRVEAGEADDPQLRTDVRGRFMWTNVRPSREDIGLNQIEVAAGSCTAAFELAVPANLFDELCPTATLPGTSSGETKYAQAVLADRPLHYWRFEETDGVEAADTAGLHAAAYSGRPALGQPGAIEGSLAILLDGDDDWVDVADLTLAGDFTIEAWIFLCEEISDVDVLVGQGRAGPDVNFGEEDFRLWDGHRDPLVGEGPMPRDRWVHVAITRAAGRLDAFLDGRPVGAGTHDAPFPVAAVGWGESGLLRGMLDEVVIYDHALSPERVAAHAAGGEGG